MKMLTKKNIALKVPKTSTADRLAVRIVRSLNSLSGTSGDAARDGDFDTLISLLDPDAIARSDETTGPRLLRGPAAIARQALMFASPAAQVRPALVNGAAGVVVTIGQTPISVMGFTVTRGKIAEIDSISNPARLQRLKLDLPQP